MRLDMTVDKITAAMAWAVLPLATHALDVQNQTEASDSISLGGAPDPSGLASAKHFSGDTNIHGGAHMAQAAAGTTSGASKMILSRAVAPKEVVGAVRRILGSPLDFLGYSPVSLGLGCLLACAAAHSAFAQSTPAGTGVPADQGAQQNQPAELQEVVVTATLRKETAQNVPVSLTVLGGPQLDKLGVTNINQVAALVPGLQLLDVEPGYSIQILRGISTGTATTGATVATYFDDTPTTASSQASSGAAITPDPDMFDVQRVEVLKGPQGTLFGASSMGGLIRYIYNQPNLDTFGGKVETGFEAIPDHGTGNTGRLLVNIPLIHDVLAIRADVFRIASPGFIDNTFRNQRNVNDGQSEGGRVTILWKPSDSFSARLTSLYQRITSNSPGSMDVQPLTLRPTSGDLNTAEKLPEPLYAKWFINNLLLSYDFHWATLLSSTSIEKQYTLQDIDASNSLGVLYGALTGGNATLLHQSIDLKKTTEEVRLTSRAGGPMDWLVGLYYTHENSFDPIGYDALDAAGAKDTMVFPNFLTLDIGGPYRETAEYGDFTYHFGPSFDLQGGLRYDRVAQTFNQTDFTFPAVPSLPNPVLPSLSDSLTQSKTTYLGDARYHLNRDTMLYARVATGYRPGGPNILLPGVSSAPATYQADQLISYELGFKGVLPSHALDYALDVYRVNWKDIQLAGADAATGLNFRTNGGKAHSQGVELQLGYRPVEGLRIGLSGSFDDAKLDQSVPLLMASASDELPYAPKVSFAGTLDYEHPVTSLLTGFAGLTVAGTGSRRAYFSGQTVGLPIGPAFLSTTGDLASYTTVDLRGGMTWSRVTLTAYAQNVTDARGAVALFGAEAGADLAHGTVGPAALTVIQPRTFGFTVSYEF